MANKLAIIVGSVCLVIIVALLFHGHGLKNELRESQEDFADEKLRSKRAQRQNLDYESRIRDLEVALRQKTEQQTNVQAELDEAEQQVQEKTDFIKEVQASLDEMAAQFGISLEAGEAVATASIRVLSERIGEQMKALQTEVDDLKGRVAGHEANANAVEESKENLKRDLEQALAKVAANTKDLTALRNDYKKINTLVQALLLSENASTADLQKQAGETSKKIQELDQKIAAAAVTTAPPKTQAPTVLAPAADNDNADTAADGDDNAAAGDDDGADAPVNDGDGDLDGDGDGGDGADNNGAGAGGIAGTSSGGPTPPKPKAQDEYNTDN